MPETRQLVIQETPHFVPLRLLLAARLCRNQAENNCEYPFPLIACSLRGPQFVAMGHSKLSGRTDQIKSEVGRFFN